MSHEYLNQVLQRHLKPFIGSLVTPQLTSEIERDINKAFERYSDKITFRVDIVDKEIQVNLEADESINEQLAIDEMLDKIEELGL